MAHQIAAFKLAKNASSKGFIFLLELTYDNNDPGNPGVLRFAKYDIPVIFAGVEYMPFAIAGIDVEESLHGEIPAFDIAVTNAGRLLMSVMEYNRVEGMRGKLLWVHPDHLANPAAKRESPFTVLTARADRQTAILTVAAVPVDLMELMLPKGVASIDELPGLLSNKVRYMV